jgi:hypothetical protein
VITFPVYAHFGSFCSKVILICIPILEESLHQFDSFCRKVYGQFDNQTLIHSAGEFILILQKGLWSVSVMLQESLF